MAQFLSIRYMQSGFFTNLSPGKLKSILKVIDLPNNFPFNGICGVLPGRTTVSIDFSPLKQVDFDLEHSTNDRVGPYLALTTGKSSDSSSKEVETKIVRERRHPVN